MSFFFPLVFLKSSSRSTLLSFDYHNHSSSTTTNTTWKFKCLHHFLSPDVVKIYSFVGLHLSKMHVLYEKNKIKLMSQQQQN